MITSKIKLYPDHITKKTPLINKQNYVWISVKFKIVYILHGLKQLIMLEQLSLQKVFIKQSLSLTHIAEYRVKNIVPKYTDVNGNLS